MTTRSVARIRQAVASRDLNRLAGQMQQQDHRAPVPPTGKPLEDRVRDLQSRALKGDQQAQRHIFMITQHLKAAESRRARGIAA